MARNRAIAVGVGALALLTGVGVGVGPAHAEGVSENGRPLIATVYENEQWWIRDVNFWTAPGDATETLRSFAEWFDANIEPVTEGWDDDISWQTPALIPPSNIAYSNHGSGTAIDINASKHPWGQAGTFTPDQTAAIRAKLAEYGGRLAWGGDYADLVDEMHFEVR